MKKFEIRIPRTLKINLIEEAINFLSMEQRNILKIQNIFINIKQCRRELWIY